MSTGANIRAETVAGKFYDNNPKRLKKTIENFLSDEKNLYLFRENTVRSIVVPHAGYSFSGQTAAKTFYTATAKNYKRIVVIAPSHYVPFKNLALPQYDACRSPLGNIEVDKSAVSELESKYFIKNDEAHTYEHSLEVQFPLIKYFFPETKIIPLICGFIDYNSSLEIAKELYKLWDEDTLWVISSDFTHYGRAFGYVPFKDNIRENIERLDKKAVDSILSFEAKEFDNYMNKTGATICGKNPILLMLSVISKAVANGEKLNSEFIEYMMSGDIVGDYSNSVSYAGISVYNA